MVVPKLEQITISETLDSSTFSGGGTVNCGDFIYHLGGASSFPNADKNTICGYKIESGGQLTQLSDLPTLRRYNKYNSAVSNGEYIYSIGGTSCRNIVWEAYGSVQYYASYPNPWGTENKTWLFPGTNAYISTPTSSNFSVTSSEWTIEGWFSISLSNPTNTLITFPYNTSGYAQLRIDITNTNKLYYYMSTTGNSWSINQTGSYTIPSSGWHHFALQRIGNDIWGWVDGHCDFHAGYGTAVTLCENNQPIRIGANTTGGYFVGYLSNFRMSNIARYPDSYSITIPIGPFENDEYTLFLCKMDNSSLLDSSTDPRTIEGFHVNQETGALTRLSGLPLLTTPSPTYNFRGASAVSYENYIYVVGGYSDLGNTAINQVLCYEVNQSTGALTKIEITGALGTASAFHQAICIDNDILIFGGYTTSPLSTIQRLAINSSTHNITNIATGLSLPIAKYYAAVGYDKCVNSNEYDIYVLGGYSTTVTNTIYSYKFNIDTNLLSSQSLTDGITALPSARSHFNAVTKNHRIYTLGGGYTLTNAIWCFESFYQYLLTTWINNSNWGSILPYGTSNIYSRENTTVSIFPKRNITAKVVDSAFQENLELSHTFTNIQNDHTLYVIFAMPYKIIASTSSNGTISNPGTQYVETDSTPSYIITPNTGYEIYRILINGEDAPITNRASQIYTFSNITGNNSIHVIFSEKIKIIATSSTNGSISPSNITYVSRY